MYPISTECPICHNDLLITRLMCPNCGTTIEGHFTLEPFFHLTPEQLGFVETFLRCAGKINCVGRELGLSYPTVRSRLEEIIRALGYEVKRKETGREAFVGNDNDEEKNQRQILE